MHFMNMHAFHTYFLIIVYTILLIDNTELLYRKNIVLYPHKRDSISAMCKSVSRIHDNVFELKKMCKEL